MVSKSIWNNFGDLNKIVDGNVDNLCITETKLEEFFSNNQFACHYNQSIYTGYYRKQRQFDGFAKSDVSSSRLNYFKIPSNTLLYLFYTF